MRKKTFFNLSVTELDDIQEAFAGVMEPILRSELKTRWNGDVTDLCEVTYAIYSSKKMKGSDGKPIKIGELERLVNEVFDIRLPPCLKSKCNKRRCRGSDYEYTQNSIIWKYCHRMREKPGSETELLNELLPDVFTPEEIERRMRNKYGDILVNAYKKQYEESVTSSQNLSVLDNLFPDLKAIYSGLKTP